MKFFLKTYDICKIILINNELHHTTKNNSIRDNLRPVSSLLGLIRQAHSPETAVEILTSGVKRKVLKRPFVSKVEKIDTAKPFTAQRLRSNDQTITDYNLTISWQSLRGWAVNDIAVSIFNLTLWAFSYRSINFD